ncbi:MAG: peptidylprolyl isomerase [Actinomycetota bacterium]|nr:peptidylprolyl isomerase [Actinomycetota bacterium]
MATEKRARKKEHRDAVLAQREAALRKRRIARLGGVVLVLAAIVVFAVVSGADDDDAGEDGKQAAEETAEPGAVACGAEAPPEPDPQQYDEPEQVLEEGVDYRAVLETSCGTIEMDLFEDEAPVTVNNFVFLATEGFYDGLTFHRIEPTFVIQGGDPEGNGQGGPGYEIEDELWAKPEEYTYGAVAMANAGADTGGSQFFVIVHEPKDQPAGLQPAYSMFGRVDQSSYETLEAIKSVETLGPNAPDQSQMSVPVTPVYIESVEIIEA